MPADLVAIAGDRLPEPYADRLLRYEHGPGVFKVDWALSEPVPWRDPACRRAGTVHIGATARDVARALGRVRRGRVPDPPFVLVAQPSLFDPTRAPAGRHV